MPHTNKLQNLFVPIPNNTWTFLYQENKGSKKYLFADIQLALLNKPDFEFARLLENRNHDDKDGLELGCILIVFPATSFYVLWKMAGH